MRVGKIIETERPFRATANWRLSICPPDQTWATNQSHLSPSTAMPPLVERMRRKCSCLPLRRRHRENTQAQAERGRTNERSRGLKGTCKSHRRYNVKRRIRDAVEYCGIKRSMTSTPSEGAGGTEWQRLLTQIQILNSHAEVHNELTTGVARAGW
jgi:hypothetical protein